YSRNSSKSTLLFSSRPSLVLLLAIGRAYTLSISGHTDDIGGEETNLKLSQDRAKACYDYLIFRGIKTERLGMQASARHAQSPAIIPMKAAS
ncbi:MAG: OmpA family protein, partial [Bacteroidota bacterium]